MALSITQPVKDFATSVNTDGVPLSELNSIVGNQVEILRGADVLTETGSTTAALRLAFRFSSHVVRYRIVATTIGAVDTVHFNGEIDPLFILSLNSASAGDTLVQDGSNTQTGFILTDPDSGARIQDVLIGRTSDNFLLLQAAVPNGTLIDIFATEFSGGEIGERLLRQAASPPHELRIRIKSDNVPTVPENLIYNNGYIVGLVGTDWVQDDRVLTGSGTEYYAFATATWNPLAGRWVIGDWQVVSAAGGTLVQFSESDLGPWHETQATADKWRRWRDGLLFWHVEPLNQLDDGWRFLTSFQWDGSQTPDPGVYTDWTKALSFPVDFNEWKYILMELEWSPTSGSEFVLVPANILSAGLASTTGYSAGIGRVVHFRRNNNGASYDDSKFDATRRSTGNILGFRYQFVRSADEASNVASQVRLIITGTHVIATLRFFVGR